MGMESPRYFLDGWATATLPANCGAIELFYVSSAGQSAKRARLSLTLTCRAEQLEELSQALAELALLARRRASEPSG